MNSRLIAKKIILLTSITFLLISNLQVFAENTYHLEIDDNSFDIKYDFEGDVIAMAIDNELTSLLIGTENVQDSQFQIELPDDLIRAENNEFAILVNGFEVDYEIISGENTILMFFVPVFTEEIEIIGTYVVPEFPLGALLILGSVTGLIVILQKSRNFLFK